MAKEPKKPSEDSKEDRLEEIQKEINRLVAERDKIMRGNQMPKDEGYLIVDHRASPGIPKQAAEKMGLDPKLVGEGRVLEAATLTCAHCGTVAIINPYRTRERGFCFQCMAYVCDACEGLRRQPDYVHLPMEKLKELVRAGKLLSRTPQPLIKGDENG